MFQLFLRIMLEISFKDFLFFFIHVKFFTLFVRNQFKIILLFLQEKQVVFSFFMGCREINTLSQMFQKPLGFSKFINAQGFWNIQQYNNNNFPFWIFFNLQMMKNEVKRDDLSDFLFNFKNQQYIIVFFINTFERCNSVSVIFYFIFNYSFFTYLPSPNKQFQQNKKTQQSFYHAHLLILLQNLINNISTQIYQTLTCFYLIFRFFKKFWKNYVLKFIRGK
eukprot:TRINITY_DN7984_c0_g1_i1.p1 TRINITY_DN7984_c0_g1~~TRINITY_DN7984_c0_g1_i1.p1  ORF type:complete len:221 (+),score=-3.00 TRINITY_DN7984_c0_g1_i1:60-722(+)